MSENHRVGVIEQFGLTRETCLIRALIVAMTLVGCRSKWVNVKMAEVALVWIPSDSIRLCVPNEGFVRIWTGTGCMPFAFAPPLHSLEGVASQQHRISSPREVLIQVQNRGGNHGGSSLAVGVGFLAARGVAVPLQPRQHSQSNENPDSLFWEEGGLCLNCFDC